MSFMDTPRVPPVQPARARERPSHGQPGGPAPAPAGREAETAEIEAMLGDVTRGLTALTLTGAPGIGKTTLWREGLRRAAGRGYRVLAARPSQAERALSFAGLADLLEQLPAGAIESLAPVQRRAIEVALLRAEAGPGPPGRAAHAAMLSLVRQLAGVGPVLIAVDDAQWLDDATAEILAFALRRLERLPVGVLSTVRVEDGRPETFDSVVPAGQRRDLMIGPLGVAALHVIVRQRLRRPLPRPVLVRVVTSCGGNPFYALEIARELERTGIPPPGEPLPVPGELQGLLRSRMARLPRRTRDALLEAACQSQPTAATVDLEAIAPGEETGIVFLERTGRLRFSHPLLAAAVREAAPMARRRAVHRRLAALAADAEERARHLAAAATGPDDAVAAALDAAVDQAARRGALAAARELARRAVELTADPSGSLATWRAIRFAEHCVLGGGDPAEARAVLQARLPGCPPGDLRAELRLKIAWAMREEGRATEGYRDLCEAFTETTDPRLTARLHLQAIWMAEADPVHGMRHCDAALALLDEAADPGTFSSLLMHRAYLRLISGGGADDEAIERGRRIEERAVRDGLTDRSPVPVIWPLLKDDLARAAKVHAEHLEWARQAGQQPLEQSMASFLSQIELLRGDWEAAARWAATLADMVEQSGSQFYWFNHLIARGMVDAHAGRHDLAAAAGAQALSIAAAAGDEPREADARQLLGFVALSANDPGGAARHLVAADRILTGLGQVEPAQYRFHPDLIEALIGIGELDAAAGHVRRLGDRARVLPRPWTLATGMRCRGLLLAARGDIPGAVAAMRESLKHHEDLQMPFERGRTLLAYGQVLRRGNERRRARSALDEALAIFTRLGAPAWADRARGDLRRIPVRRSAAGLTGTEEQIARLAAAGLTNRQIAERAFVSPKTVEAILTRAYAKLGVRSRVQLAQVMARRAGPAGQPGPADRAAWRAGPGLGDDEGEAIREAGP